MNRRAELLFSGFLLLLFLGAAQMALPWPTKASWLPLLSGVVGGGCALVELVRSYQRSPQAVVKRDIADVQFDEGDVWAPGLRFFAWLLVMALLIWAIGFLVSIFAFAAAFLYWEGKHSLLASLVTAGLVCLFIYLTFGIVLDLIWPETLLSRLLPS